MRLDAKKVLHQKPNWFVQQQISVAVVAWICKHVVAKLEKVLLSQSAKVELLLFK